VGGDHPHPSPLPSGERGKMRSMGTWIAGFILLVVKLGVVLLVLLLVAAYLVWVERKLLGRLQVRYGPNRAGRFGLLQPLADLIKLVTKEDTVPEAADKTIFLLAPAVVGATAMLIFAVIPFGNGFTLWGKPIPMVITDLNVGLLFVVALSSLGVYGVALGGWASNSKYSLLGGIRGAAQMISYELSLGLSLVPIVMLARSFSLVDIVNAQAHYPFILVQPISFLIFFVSAAAEIKRIPFDLPEAENELVAGYHTEYSGMRFGLFFLGEYITLIVLGGLVAAFFLGGWRGPLLPPLVWFILKVLATVFVMIWMRGTLPRLRYDQLMFLGWKVFIPVALLNIMATGAVILMMEP
jgi:NADH-quinone oxidoreductase subunit H